MTKQLPIQRLGEVEQLVLLALVRLDAPAYAVPIRDLIANRTGVELSLASLEAARRAVDRLAADTAFEKGSS